MRIESERWAPADVYRSANCTEGASAINGSTIPVEDGLQIFKNS